MKEFVMKAPGYREVVAIALVLAAILSFVVLGGISTSIDTHESNIASLDEKIDTVLKLTASSTAASAIISAMPDDTFTPISEKLADFTEYFLLVLCVLYAEKYGLTILGFVAFRILVPLACLLGIISLYGCSDFWKRLGVKLAVFGLAIYCVIPASLAVSDMIYATYEESIQNTITAAEQISLTSLTEEEKEEGSVLSNILGTVTNTAKNLLTKASDVLNRFVETLGIVIVTSCLIPLLVLAFFIWLVKIVTGVDIGPVRPHIPRHRPAAPHGPDDSPALPE